MAEVGIEQFKEPGVGRVGRVAGGFDIEHRESVDAFAEVGARCLAADAAIGRDVDEIVGELEGHPEPLAIGAKHLNLLGAATAEHGAVARCRRHEDTGLVGQYAQVVGDRVGVRRARQGVADLPLTQPHEGLRLDEDRLRAEARDEFGRLTKQQVPHQDRGRVVVCRVDTLHTTAHRCLVHDIVVIERREMRELDPDSCRDDLVGEFATRERRENRQSRPEPLAARRQKMARGSRDVRVVMVDGMPQQIIDSCHPVGQLRRQPRGHPGERQHARCTHAVVIPWLGR